MARIELVSSNPSLVLGLSFLDRDWDVASAPDVSRVAHAADVVVLDVRRGAGLVEVPASVGLVVLADEADVPALDGPGVLLHRPCTIDDIADAIDAQLRRERQTTPQPSVTEDRSTDAAPTVEVVDAPALAPSGQVAQSKVVEEGERSLPPLFAGFAARRAPDETVRPIALEPAPATTVTHDRTGSDGATGLDVDTDPDEATGRHVDTGADEAADDTPFADALREFAATSHEHEVTDADGAEEDGAPSPSEATVIDLTTPPVAPGPDEPPTADTPPVRARLMPVTPDRPVRSTVMRVAPPLPEVERQPFTTERAGLKLLDRESTPVKRRSKLLARRPGSNGSQRSMEERLGRMLFAASELEHLLEELPVLRDRSALASVIVAEAFESLALDTCGLWVWQDGAWKVLATQGFTLHERRMEVQASQPLFSEVHATGGAVLIDPIEQVMAAVAGIGGAHTRSFAAAAIAAGEGRYGIIAAGRDLSLDSDDLDDLLALARQAAPGMAAAELVARLARSAAQQADAPTSDDDGAA